ncbi:MAG: nuclear transport factor 2 family protein [Gillisia sp.]|nr:nuclear transport factor 2 family protein [Gillisia sp.]
MKNKIFIILTFALFTSCPNTNEERYTQNSPEIDTYKQLLKDYEMGNWEAMAVHYADTAKIYYNEIEKNPRTISESIEEDRKNSAILSSYGYIPDSMEFEMVVTDDGETWVNFWGVWQGRLAENNKLFEIPSHMTIQFVNGKIVKEYGYWNNTEMVLELMDLEKQQAEESAAEEPEDNNNN